MNKRKIFFSQRFYFLVALSFFFGKAEAQTTLHDTTLDTDFEAQVKSIDEFMARFNGDESKPGIKVDANQRKNNIISLFDFSMSKQNESKEALMNSVLDFCESVENWPSKLTILNAGAWAETDCTLSYNKKNIKITFLMQLESIDSVRCRWAIAGVKGLKKAGLYNDKRATISPVDHEVHFVSLNDFFKSNKNIAPTLRSRDKDIDEFSMFVGMITSGSCQFVSVDDVKFHFTDVPNYVFVVEEIGRRGTNSGWLITKFQKLNDEEKIDYVNNLFGIK